MWGRGLTTEAATAAGGWATAHVPHLRIVPRVRPTNRPSRRVALKAGLHRAPAWDEEGYDGLDHFFTLPPPPAPSPQPA
ncbi:MAG: GNAT family N-acetyltransferase [Motilibacteraceae bacterium]